MTKRKNSETAKRYAVIVLALTAGILAYFRFLYDGPRQSPASTPSSRDTDSIEIPSVEEARVAMVPRSETAARAYRRVTRDIFEPPKRPVAARVETVEQSPPADEVKLELKATARMGGAPIAIVNGRFLRSGDSIGKYTVARIEQGSVFLQSDRAEETVLTVAETPAGGK